MPPSSPVLVKIVRALTPGGRQRPHSTAGGRPAYARQSSVNRVFQIVKEGLDGVRIIHCMTLSRVEPVLLSILLLC